MSLCTAITAGGPCLLPFPCRVHGDDGGWESDPDLVAAQQRLAALEAPLGGTEERTEDVGAPRSQRERYGPGAATAELRPDNRFYREPASGDTVSVSRDDLRQLLGLLLYVHDSILRQSANDALLRRMQRALGR